MMKPFVCWMLEWRDSQTSHEPPKVFGQLVAVKWEAVQVPEHKVSMAFCCCEL